MGNPLIHTLVFVAAVLIPGGLLVYFGWRAARRLKKDPSLAKPTVEEAREAFFRLYPKESLRARSRINRLERRRRYRRKIPKQ